MVLGSVALVAGWTARAAAALQVGTNSVPPFVFLDEETGEPTGGFSLDLWEILVEDLDEEDYTWKTFDTVPDLLAAVETGEVDLAIAAVTATAEREERLDFSHPYYESGLRMMVRDRPTHPLAVFWQYLFSRQTLEAIGVVLGLGLLSAHLLWFFERNRNEEMFPRSYWRGIWEALWWSLVTATTVGYGDKAPVGFVGRAVAIVWMFGGLFVVAYFTAALTSNRLELAVDSLADLRNQRVAVVEQTTAADYARNRAVRLVTFENAQKAYDALEAGRVRAVIGDAPVLMYRASQDRAFRAIGPLMDPQFYAIALPENSPLLEPLNRALLQSQESGQLQAIDRKWFPDEEE